MPPPGGGRPNEQFSAAKVKVEQTLAEKIYIMLICADAMKQAHSSLFPALGPQKVTNLKLMFTPPQGVAKMKINKAFYGVIISNIRQVEMGSREEVGLSTPVKRMYIKQSDQESVETSNNKIRVQGAFVMNACFFLRVSNVPVLVLDPSHLLKYNTREEYFKIIRNRWYTMNLLRFPTSPQVVAAQIIRNHARLFSENKLFFNVLQYPVEVQRLMRECTGIERALVPEQHMDTNGHMRLSWYRIRKRVLERMIEEMNKQMTPEDERRFLASMPFNIRTIQHLLTEIQSQMAICDSLWHKERAGEIQLSDGPDMEDEEMYGEVEGGQMEGRDGEEGGMMRQMQQQQHVQQPAPWAPPMHNLPPGASRMNHIYNGMQQQQQQRRNVQTAGGGGGGGTLASVLAQQMTKGRGEGGRSAALPQTPPSSGVDRTGRKMIIRRDAHGQHFVDGASPSPSSSTRPTPSVPSVPVPSPSTSTARPSTSAQQPRAPQQPLTPHPLPPPQSRVVVGSGHGTAQPQPAFSPLLASSPHLFLVGANGIMQSLPSIVYVERTEEGLVEVTPPNPQPQLVMTIPSMEGERGRDVTSSRRSLPFLSSSVKRRQSTSKHVVKKRRRTQGESGEGRRKVYAESADGSSEDSTDQEGTRKRIQARNARYEKYAKERKEKEERIQMEELKRKEEYEKEDKREEEIRKKEEEAKRKEDEERKKREEAERMESERVRKETEEVVVLAVDSGDESGEERAVASEDEVVPTSIADEEMTVKKNKEENANCAVSTVVALEEMSGEKNSHIETNNTPVMAESALNLGPSSSSVPSVPCVPCVRPVEEPDSEIEYLFCVPGKEKPINKEYCEVVKGLSNMKRELDEKAAENGIIVLKHIEHTGKSGSPATVGRKNRGSLNGCINNDVKEEAEERSENTVTVPAVVPPVTTPVKTENTEKSAVEEESRETVSGETNDTAMTVVKIEVKKEVKEEKDDGEKEDMEEEEDIEDEEGVEEEEEGENDEEEEEAETTIIERRTEQVPVQVEEEKDVQMEDVMNRSTELFDEEEEEATEDTERRRSVVEAMTQEDSSEVPFIVAPSVIEAVPVVTTECLPMVTSSESAVDTSLVETTPSVPLTTEESAVDRALSVSASPSPRSAPIRVPSLSSQQTERTPTLSTRMPPITTRLSEEMIDMLKRTDSLLSPYEKRMEEMQGRVERGREKTAEKEKEKEKEVVQVINDEPPLTEMDNTILRFHVKRGEAAVLSEDRRCATRDESIDRISKALVFTNRPLFKGENITLKVTEISPDWKGRIRFGLTPMNPMEYSTGDVFPRQQKSDNGEGPHDQLYDSGVMNTVKLDTLLGVELSEGGEEMRYSFDGVDMGLLGGGLPVDRPLWMFVDIYGFVKGIEIVTPTQTTEEAQPPVDVSAADPLTKESRELIEEEKEKEDDKEVVSPSSPSVSQVAIATVEEETETGVVSEERDTLHSPIEDISTPTIVPSLPLSLITVLSPIETSKNAVEEGEDVRKEDDTQETAVTVMGEGMKEGEEEEEGVIVDEVREEEGPTTEDEPVMETVEEDKEEGAQKEAIVEKRSIERNEEEEKEEERPPTKKIRIEIETVEVVMENEGQEETEEKETRTEEEGSETPSVVATIEVIEKEEKEIVAPVVRRRSLLFGPGCLPFDRTMDAKNDKEEEDEEEMEVDEEEDVEKEETEPVSLRRFSLFGPGCASFGSLLQRMAMKRD